MVIRDITDRSLRRLQEQFIATAAHELRTPLTTLSGRLQLLSRHIRKADVSDVLRDHVRLALEQVRRLENDVADLMDGARLQAGRLILERKPLDLAAIVEEAAELSRSLANGQEIVVELPEEPIHCEGDARRLVRVLLNLIGNAVTHARDTNRIDVRLCQADRAALIEVQDYGPGIPEHVVPNLFTRFYQGSEDASRHGLGLGLFISREIVEGLGGTIEVRSKEGAGATFVVRLPLSPATGGSADE